MTNKKEIIAPFSGFCESIHDGFFDSEINRDLENLACEYGLNNEILQGYAEKVYSLTDWQKTREHYCRVWLDGFVEEFEDLTGLFIDLEYETLDSPREYNFTTDRLVATISESDIKKLYRACDKTILQQVIKERFTSYDGFISFYSNDLNDWMAEKHFTEWDHNQLETLLLALIRQYGGDDYVLYDFEMEIAGSLIIHEVAAEALYAGTCDELEKHLDDLVKYGEIMKERETNNG